MSGDDGGVMKKVQCGESGGGSVDIGGSGGSNGWEWW